jgi:prepilin-type processing-associated H-X9-DG protein
MDKAIGVSARVDAMMTSQMEFDKRLGGTIKLAKALRIFTHPWVARPAHNEENSMRRPPRAISLIETLVVVAVTLILGVILIAVVKRARDAGRRGACVENLKQIGIALQSYHAARNCYPLGVTASLNPMSQFGAKFPGAPTDWSGWSPHAQLLPYLGQTTIYNAINFEFDPFINQQEPMNTTAHHFKVDVFLCPDDPFSNKPSLNSYYGSLGTNFQNEAHQTTGIFAYQTPYSVRDVTDGESNTVAFAEGLSGNSKATKYPGNGVVNVGVRDSEPGAASRRTAEKYTAELVKNLQACHDGFQAAHDRSNAISGNRGQYWTWGSEGMSLFHTLVPPGSTRYAFNQCRYDCPGCLVNDADHSDITNASSAHPGGANALFCDGSVHFIKGSIALPAWWALGTKNLGEPVHAGSY